jgi:hypothetical protein
MPSFSHVVASEILGLTASHGDRSRLSNSLAGMGARVEIEYSRARPTAGLCMAPNDCVHTRREGAPRKIQ